MGFAGAIGSIFGAAAKEPIEAIGGVIDELYTSKEEKLSHEEAKIRLLQRPMLSQMAVNQVEAQHRSIFVAGWRPAVGWICASALAYIWLLRNLFSDVSVALGYGPMPALDIGAADVTALLGPLLGIATLRTSEKITGKAK